MENKSENIFTVFDANQTGKERKTEGGGKARVTERFGGMNLKERRREPL